MFALPTAHTEYTAIVWVKVSSLECGLNLQGIEKNFWNNNLWRQTEGMKNAYTFFWTAGYVACLLLGNYSWATTEKQHEMLQIRAEVSSSPKPYIVKPVSVNRTSRNLKNGKEESGYTKFSVWFVPDQCQLFHHTLGLSGLCKEIFWSS